MVAITPDAATPAGCTVDRPGAAACEALQSAPQCLAIVRLDDEVEVVRLGREVDEAKVISIGASKRLRKVAEEALGPQRGEAAVRT